jgi:DNA-binding MarR family transcriptional regulator
MADSFDRTTAEWRRMLPDLPTDTYDIFGRVHLLASYWTKALGRFGARYGLRLGEVYVLLALRRAPGKLTPTELYQHLSISSGTISKRLERLVTHGLVQRTIAPADARSVRVSLTPKGKRAVDTHFLYSKEFMYHAGDVLAEPDRRELIRLLRSLLGTVEAVESAAGHRGPNPRAR